MIKIVKLITGIKNEKISSKTDQINQSFKSGEVVMSKLPRDTLN